MSVQTSILLQCYEHAASASKGALERCLDLAVAALQEAETKAAKGGGREELGDAWRELQSRKPSWCERFPRELMAAFKSAGHAAVQDGVAVAVHSQTSAIKPKAMALSLADDTQLADAIEATRLLQSILPVVDQPLSEVSARISTALGLASVMSEFNPLRPEIFTQTLRAMVASAGLAPAASSLAMKHMTAPLGQELKAIYVAVAALLERANVQAAEYRVLLTPGGPGAQDTKEAKDDKTADEAAKGKDGDGTSSNDEGKDAPGTDAKGTAADLPAISPEQYANLHKLENSDALIRDFLARGAQHTPQPLAPTYYEAVDKELAAIHAQPEPEHAEPPELAPEYRETPAIERPHRIVDALSQLSSKVWGVYGRAKERALVHVGLKKEAKNTAQVIGLEVVRKVVGEVAQDPRVLAPVREAIVALEPSLLRLALVDPRFLTDEAHPGRRLVESVAQRSFRHNDEFSPDFEAFFQPVTETFNVLNGMSVSSPKPFEAAANGLAKLWADEDLSEQQQGAGVLRTLDAAEGRQALADQIAQELSQRSDIEGTPAMVLEFLYGPWSLVMADARLSDQNRQPDPGGFGSAVTDLLWSVKLEFTFKEPARLLALIPALLGKLRAGLQSLGQDPAQSEEFLGKLMRLHQPVLERMHRRRLAPGAAPAPAPTPMPEAAPATAEQRKPRSAEAPWLGPQEQSAAGFGSTVMQQPSEFAADAAANGDGAGPDPSSVLAGLGKGSRVELRVKDRWMRAQLVWTNAKRNMYMFVSNGRQPHSMTNRSAEKLIAQQQMRPLGQHEVVAQALDSLKKP